MTEEKPSSASVAREFDGGTIGGKGYSFQAAYIVSRIPIWLDDPDFTAFIQEGAGDVEVLFNRADDREELWYIQVKDHPVKLDEARKVFAEFGKADSDSPGAYTLFKLACPGLHENLRGLQRTIEDCRGLALMYERTPAKIMDSKWQDLEARVTSLKLREVDAPFLAAKVDFDTDLPGLTRSASLRRQFVGGMLEMDAWAGVAPAGLFRAYEKLALLCHQEEGIRNTYSRQDLEAMIRNAVSEVPATSDHHFVVPFPWNPDFVGREEDLECLHRSLTGECPAPDERARPGGIRPVGLTGMGGIGKTQMAVEYAYRFADDYPDGVFWLGVAEDLAKGFAELGQRFKPETADGTRDERIRAAAGYLRQHPRALLILDNVAEPADLNRPVTVDLVPAGLPCRVLFTTRRRDLGHFTSIEVMELPEDLSLRLLLRHPGRQAVLEPDHLEHEDARTICATLGYLPLALELAGAHLSFREEAPLSAYLQELLARGALPVLDDPRAGIRADDLPTRHEAAVGATLKNQWEALENEDARLLLRVAGQLPEATMIPVARLGLLAGLDDQEGGFFGSPLDLALEALVSASLVEELREGHVRLHPLVREFAARQTPREDTLVFREWCAANAATAYEKVGILEAHCARRGVDALQADLMTALNFLPEVPTEQDSLSTLQPLLRVLQRDAHVLRSLDWNQNPTLFAQQVYYRAFNLSLSSIANQAEKHLADRGFPHLALHWRAGSESVELLTNLAGHSERVQAVTALPDGHRLVSGCGDGIVKVWDLETGQELFSLIGHKSAVYALATTRDGRVLATASADSTVKIWDLQTRQELSTLVGHKGSVRAIDMTQDGRLLVSGASDGILKVWDLDTGSQLHTVVACDRIMYVRREQVRKRMVTGSFIGRVDAVAVTPDGHYAVSGSQDNTVRLWNLETGEQIRSLSGHSASVRGVTVTQDGRHIVSCSDDRAINIWDLETGEKLQTLSGHSESVRGVTVTQDGRHIVSCSDDHTIKVWSFKTGENLRTLTGHHRSVNAVVVTLDGEYIISGSDDRSVRVWYLEMDQGLGQTKQPARGHDEGVLMVTVMRSGHHAFSVSEWGIIKKWDIATGKELPCKLEIGGVGDGNQPLFVTPDCRRALIQYETMITSGWGEWSAQIPVSGTIVLDIETEEDLDVDSIHDIAAEGIPALAATADGRYLMLGPEFGLLEILDLEGVNETRSLALEGHQGVASASAVTPDGSCIIVGFSDCSIRVWDLETGRELHTLTEHCGGGVTAVSLSSDRRYALSGSRDGFLSMWNLKTGESSAAVHLEAELKSIAMAQDGITVTILAGDSAGNVYCLRYLEPPGPRSGQ